jgi:hypothetical protein
MSKARNAKRSIYAVGAAAAVALSASSVLFAQEQPAAPPKVEAAPDLAPGIAPGVVPGARPGGHETPLGTAGPGAGAPTPGPAPGGGVVTPDENAAVKISPSSVIDSPDWPCVQRKVMSISPAQIWDGPPIDQIKDPEKDEKIADLLPILESRRVSSEDAEKAIKEFAKAQPEAERDKKLTELFAALIAKINTDRSFVMSKVEEFQKRQKARAAELEREGQELAEKGMAATEELLPTETKLSPEQQEYNWNARIFQERQQNLTMACEIPALIEQRAYEIARLIRAEMKS